MDDPDKEIEVTTLLMNLIRGAGGARGCFCVLGRVFKIPKGAVLLRPFGFVIF
jgi:hypothetical protein